MTFGAVISRRLIAGAISGLLALSMFAPGTVLGASTDPELLATLEHPKGDIEYELELGTLHFFDEENAPCGVAVLDGCAVNDHLWLYGVGLSGIGMPLTVMDLNTGKNRRMALPAFEPGKPVGTILDPDALPLCGDEPVGGLPPLSGTAIFTSTDARGRDFTEPIELRSEGRNDAYRRVDRSGVTSDIITRGSPIAAIDDDGAYDQFMLLTEGRTPRRVEGVVFTGDEGMLPSRAKLDKALKGITNGRVRRAFEAAQNGDVPQPIIEDLGLKGVDRVHHIRLELETLGADAYLAEAGWIKEGGKPLVPPQPVEERFTVELAKASGESTRLPLLGPLVGSEAEGRHWQYGNGDAIVRIVDGCDLSGSFWILAGAKTDEPLELLVTDTSAGTTVTTVLWTDRRDVSRLSDSSSLSSCP